MAIGVHLNDVFSIPRYLFGFEGLLMAMVDGAGTGPRAGRAFGRDRTWRWPRRWPGAGPTSSSPATTTPRPSGPFMSPRAFRELFYPGLKRVVAGFHEPGLPVIKHTDGNIRPLLDMILDSGIDCLDPIDPIAGHGHRRDEAGVRRPGGAEGQRRLRPHAHLRHRSATWSRRPRR